MPPTLRASCDTCNLAKVKCTKTTPHCARCKKHNIDCIYGISLRAGKRSSQPTLPEVAKVLSSPNEWNMDLSTSATTYSPIGMDMDIYPSIFEHDMPCILDDYMPLSEEPFSSMPELSYSGSDHMRAASTEDPSPVLSAPVLSLSTAMIRPSLSQSLPSQVFATCSCFRNTTLVLCTLHQLSESTHTSFDMALVHNKEAIVVCMAALKCRCSTDGTILLLITSLIAKIIAIYQTPCGAWQAVEIKAPSHDTRGISARMTLGSYKVEEGDEEGMKMEIIRMELRKVETLISRMKEQISQDIPVAEQRLREGLAAFLSENLRLAYEAGTSTGGAT